MQKIFDELTRQGCRSSYSGSTLTVTNIPNWKVYLYLREHLDAILMAFEIHQVMNTPMQPIEYQEHHDKCGFCSLLSSDACTYESYAIPAAVHWVGCDKWIKNDGVYF